MLISVDLWKSTHGFSMDSRTSELKYFIEYTARKYAKIHTHEQILKAYLAQKPTFIYYYSI